MKKGIFFTLFTVILVLASSCGKEVLTPLVSPVSINELRNDQPVNFSYKIDSTEIEEYAKNTAKFPIFGKLFQGIAFVIANTVIPKKGHQLEIEPIEIDLDPLREIDFDFIDWIRFDSLLASIDNAKKKDNLEFIDKIEIFAVLDSDSKNSKSNMIRLVHFDRKKQNLECDGRCVNFRIEQINWKELIQSNQKIKIYPKILINSVPKSTMSLAGSVSFSVKFNFGF